MSKREEILRTSLRKLSFVDMNLLLEIPSEEIEIVSHVFSGEKAYIGVEIYTGYIHAEIDRDDLCYMLYCNGLVTNYDLTSGDVEFMEYSENDTVCTLRTVPVEHFFNNMNNEDLKEILFNFCENYV